MRPEQRTTIPENPHVHILDSVLLCPKPYFNIVKQEIKCNKLIYAIFHPIYILSLFKTKLRLFSDEINHFSTTFEQI